MIVKHLLKASRQSADNTIVNEAGLSWSHGWTSEAINDAADEVARQLRECPRGSAIGIATDKISGLLIASLAAEIAACMPVLLPAMNGTAALGDTGLPLSALLTDGENSGELSVELCHSPNTTHPAFSSDAVVLFTSGTSTPPKPVIHTWKSLSSAVRQGAAYQNRRWLLAYHPRTFAGIQVILQALMTGGTLYRAAKTPDGVWQQLLQSEVEYASATPSFWRAMLIDADPGVIESRLQQITMGGEVADQHLLDRLRLKFPQTDIAHIYASTEMGMCFSVRDGKAGFPASWLEDAPPGCELRIASDGELLLRSSRQMQGYVKSEPKLENEQWFETGDLVELVGDRVQFRGRKGDAINVGGYKVQPQQIEDVIRPVPGVIDVCVYGIASSLTGQLAAADIQIRPECDANQLRTSVVAACHKTLPQHMIPAQVTLSAESILIAGKIRRPR